MGDELKPCPFCGGEAKAFFCEESGTYDVQCQQCGALPFLGRKRGSGRFKSMDDVIAAWNRRTERTCRPEVCDDGAVAWGVYCSECGYRFAGPYGKREVPEHMAGRRDIMPRYCTSCGARVEVVDE